MASYRLACAQETVPSKERRHAMGRGILLWLLGVPIPIILLLFLFFR